MLRSGCFEESASQRMLFRKCCFETASSRRLLREGCFEDGATSQRTVASKREKEERERYCSLFLCRSFHLLSLSVLPLSCLTVSCLAVLIFLVACLSSSSSSPSSSSDSPWFLSGMCATSLSLAALGSPVLLRRIWSMSFLYGFLRLSLSLSLFLCSVFQLLNEFIALSEKSISI